MYEEYWKLQEKPFENIPDLRFLYHSLEHEEALSRMLYVVREKKGAAILTGECGSGKTLLSRVLLDELSKDHYRTAIVFNPRRPALELLKEIVYQLDGNRPSFTSKTDILHYLDEVLQRNMYDNMNTVIVVDEAQAIADNDTFEELRLLLNFQSNEGFLLTLILLGQPELKERIINMPQLRQRLSVRFHLTALSEAEAREYVRHRLVVAGSKEPIFTEDAFGEIYRFSKGIPRGINNICDMALLVGCGAEIERIDKKTIRAVAEDLGETPIDEEAAEEASLNG